MRTKLIDQVRRKIRTIHYSYRTEEAYVGWIKRYVHFHEMTHPNDLGDDAIEQFLSHLATRRTVSAGTQNQALLFLYQHVLSRPTSTLSFTRAKRTRRIPVILSRNEVQRIISRMKGKYRLMGYLLYGSGLRLRECLALRVKDVDTHYGQLIVRDAKGGKDYWVGGPLVGDATLRSRAGRFSAVKLGILPVQSAVHTRR